MKDAAQDALASDVNVANIVASGKFDVELDLAEVAEDLPKLQWIEEAEHSRRSGNRLLVHFPQGDTLGIIAPSGVYVFTGVDSYEGLEYAKNNLLSALSELGIISGTDPDSDEVADSFEVQNVVCTAELNAEEGLNLNELAIGLGLEKTEYEPEQFPGLIYRPDTSSCTILVFGSGKVVITGVDDEEIAQIDLHRFQDELSALID